MKPKQQFSKQPAAAQLQALFALYQQGDIEQTLSKARALLQQFPNTPVIYNVLGICQEAQGKYQDAAASYRKAQTLDPRVAEIRVNLGAVLARLGETDAALASYQSALKINPKLVAAHYNLGILLQARGELPSAAHHYQQALNADPNFFKAYGNLGALQHQRGMLDAAEQCYRKALALRADAQAYFNLGTALHDKGEHAEAIRQYRQAISLQPQYAEAWTFLGETLRDQGVADEAFQCYQQALALQPQHGRALYNCGEALALAGKLGEALDYFSRSDFADAADRVLLCLYKTRQFDRFRQQLQHAASGSVHRSILLAALSAHHATNFQQADAYNFCQTPMAHVLHTRLDELAQPNSAFLAELLRDIQSLAIAERRQGRLIYGIQSAGNLLKRPEASFQKLATHLRAKVAEYRQHFAHSPYDLINVFPPTVEFSSSWYLRMQKGGHLTSHIHEEGWISGCVYLQLPNANNAHEGSFVIGTDGDDYPRQHDDFPNRIVDLTVGDLVIIPSSLFHRTIPFHSDQDRVCVAFDIKPATVQLAPPASG